MLIDDSLALNNRQESLSPEQYEQLLSKLNNEHKKVISVGTISDSEKVFIRDITNMLHVLRGEVEAKKEGAIKQSFFIKAKVQELINSGKVQIHEDEYKRSEESVIQYAGLLDNIIVEIDNELNFFGLFLADQTPSQIVVWMNEPDSFHEYLLGKISFIKKYIKNIRKDLNVSFSRYTFGFQAQIQRILQVEAYIHYQSDTQQKSN
jgi:hypothetical protein